ncbi:RimK family protein [Alteromonas sp. a30]|uniref:RimK family protein n=1 Tax=Alteromonas sp. a30 TaxID=2730917 RepID=UPI00227EEFA0|nr:RimK family protein [Alteromonas sp. a30]MCY7296727.1 RimK family protein [Alteromonas sp. a30]
MAKTLIVVDNKLNFPAIDAEVIDFSQYLADFPKQGEGRTRIINLCDTEGYLSQGYYCSLLAEARQHKVMPSVSTINDLAQALNNDKEVVIPIPNGMLKHTHNIQADSFYVYFGSCEAEVYQKLAKHIFLRFPTPILHVKFRDISGQWFAEIDQMSMSQLDADQQHVLFSHLSRFTNKVWRSLRRKKYRWDMAILVNPKEATPSSNKQALTKFVKAAEQLGINAELVSHDQINMLNKYDALFLRETTSIRHHTYALARKAEQEGLVVIDDPTSILRCCNKIFLHDAFTYNQVPTLKTRFVSCCNDETLEDIEKTFSYPVVLKLPESSFSLGVFKAKNREELVQLLSKLLQESALVLVQEYFSTDFDWRIGVLNGRALYACRYYMARNHWQIYNHASKRNTSGGFDTLPTFEVPHTVLQAAMKACRFIGNGLYGVDIKQADDRVCVIEVNDNPSIEHKVEDAYLGDELYMQIMQEFADRLEARGR